MSAELEMKFKEIVAQIGRVFEIDNVPLLIQLIVKDSEVNVIEFSARTGGGSKLFFIREMVGVDVIDNLLDITLGQVPVLDARPSKEKAVINYVYTYPGVFATMENLDVLEKNGYIASTYQYKPFGTQITSSNYSNDRPVGFLIKAPTEKELKEKINHINATLKICDEKGQDIMRHEIFSADE